MRDHTKELPNKRIVVYDNMKYVLILLVVMGHIVKNIEGLPEHVAELTFDGIYMFHMPAFLFLSGLMNRLDAKMNWRQVLTFLLLAYCYKILNTLVVSIGEGRWQFSFWVEEQVPWYLLAMAFYPVIAHVLRNCNPIFVTLFTIVLGCMVGFDEDITKSVLAADRLVVFFPYYWIGCQLDKEELRKRLKRLSWKITSVGILIGYGVCLWLLSDRATFVTHMITGNNEYSKWALSHEAILLRMGFYLIGIVMIVPLVSLIPDRPIPIVTTGGSRTLSIYFWHRNLIRILTYTGIVDGFLQITGRNMTGVWILAGGITLLLTWSGFQVPIRILQNQIAKISDK